MEEETITVIYHEECKPSMNFLDLIKNLNGYKIILIDIVKDNFDTDLDIDIIPFMCIGNKRSEIFKGKEAFNKIEELLRTKKDSKGVYGSVVTFKEDIKQKNEVIDLEAASKKYKTG
jgi:hypothetical protein